MDTGPSAQHDHAGRRQKIALLSPTGWGNLGDATILDAAVLNLRQRFPDVEIIGLTLNPEDTVSRHGISAYPILGVSRRWYAVKVEGTTVPSSLKVPDQAQESHSWKDLQTSRLRAAVRKISFLRQLVLVSRKVRGFVGGLVGELFSVGTAFGLARELRTLVVAGGGQLDDFWGGPWGHPYALLRWTVLARLRGVRVVFLSVGTGSLRPGLSRFFVSAALRLADYRSFRDQGSRDLVRFAAHTREDPVVPDLAFSYPLQRAVFPPAAQAVRVGVSPMCYCHPRAWPKKDKDLYEGYVDRLASFSASLLGRGVEVILFASCRSDRRVMEDIMKQLRALGSENGGGNVRVAPYDGVATLFETLAEVDVVMASRLHGVILSLVARKPVFALSYERKVDVIMKDLGLTEYCLPIHDTDSETLMERFDSFLRDREVLAKKIERVTDEYRKRLGKQFDQVFEQLRDPTV